MFAKMPNIKLIDRHLALFISKFVFVLLVLVILVRNGYSINLESNVEKIDHIENTQDIRYSEDDKKSKEGKFGISTTISTGTEIEIEVAENIYEIPQKDWLRGCGNMDQCPDLEKVKENRKKGSGYEPGQEKLDQSPQVNPFFCRCDVEECVNYGDCCVTLRTPISPNIQNKSVLIRKMNNPWRCHPLQKQLPQTWALMVSECPTASAEADDGTQMPFCSGSVKEIPPQHYSYLADIPAYSNRTKIFYKNIFCALCNGEENSDIVKWTMKLYCNHELLDRPLFFDNATYIPFERKWQNPQDNKTCKLVIPELEIGNIETYIPNVRYCGYNTEPDHCPPDYEDENNTALLCASYTQYVFDRTTARQYKNPHCAVCHGSEKKKLTCVRFVVDIFTRVNPKEAGATLQGAGLNFLFDFGMQEGDNYVGYKMLCANNEIWDYVRRKCHPLICGKNHKIQDGRCMPKIIPVVIAGSSNSEKGVELLLGQTEMNTSSNCYRILLFSHEFQLFDNNSISVNKSNNEIIILEDGDYEVVNSSMVSICAKYLHEAFPARFSQILDYLTIVSLGLSVSFSFLHMFLFVVLPKLRNLPSKNLFCLTLCLFISQLSFLTLIRRAGKGDVELCIAAAFIMHFFFLAAFFWMNILSFDIWRTFGSIMMRRSGSTGSRKRTFIKYSCFAWSIPLLIVTLGVLTDFIFVDSPESSLFSKIKPSYGENGLCWISQRLGLFVFFTIPVAIIIFFNLILFTKTAVSILIQQKESSKVLRDDHSTASDKDRFKLYIKLAMIMGLTWILGFVSAFLSWDWLWYPFVVLNGLQGTFIFFSFDFKWKVFQMFTEVVFGRKSLRRGVDSQSSNTANAVTLSTSGNNRISVLSHRSSSIVNV